MKKFRTEYLFAWSLYKNQASGKVETVGGKNFDRCKRAPERRSADIVRYDDGSVVVYLDAVRASPLKYGERVTMESAFFEKAEEFRTALETRPFEKLDVDAWERAFRSI